MAWRVDVPTYRRLTVLLLGGAAVVGAGAALLLSRDTAAPGAALALAAVVMAAATFFLRLRGDLRGETVVLLTRAECPVCDDAQRLLESWQDEFGYDLWVVDVDTVPAALRDEYTARVPVVMHRGAVVSELDAQAERLRSALGAP